MDLGSEYCESYKSSCTGSVESCTTIEKCEVDGKKRRFHCFTMWSHNETSQRDTVLLKGCFLNEDECVGRTTCVENRTTARKDYLFCCCAGNNCNRHFEWHDRVPVSPLPPTSSEIPNIGYNTDGELLKNHNAMIVSLVIAIPLAVLLFVLFMVVWSYYRTRKPAMDVFSMTERGVRMTSDFNASFSATMNRDSFELLEIVGHGKYGVLWKARLNSATLAVKMMSAKNKKVWTLEKRIYELANMTHPNILRYHGCHEDLDRVGTELWLITDFHQRGSLLNYLKENVVSWNQFCKIAFSLMNGLAYLHDDMPAIYGKKGKHTVVHRDIKPANILVKDDLTVCLADFGMALIFDKTDKDLNGNLEMWVGTMRYMAPEVLEGAINFDKEYLEQADVYACSLVLWETASRCVLPHGTVKPYKMAYEDETGLHPTLEEMIHVVVVQGLRPRMPEHWRIHSGMAIICQILEECWDQDTEARISIACAIERITEHLQVTEELPILNDLNANLVGY